MNSKCYIIYGLTWELCDGNFPLAGFNLNLFQINELWEFLLIITIYLYGCFHC